MNHVLLKLSPSVVPMPKEGDLATHNVAQETKVTETEKGLKFPLYMLNFSLEL